MMLSQVRNSLLEKSLDNCMNHRSGYRHVLTRTGLAALSGSCLRPS